MAKKFTAVTAAKMRRPGRYAAGDGLYLQVTASGAKSWIFRYQRGGRARHMGLGAIELVPLIDAREKARDARKQLLDGADPVEARRAERAAAILQTAKAITFQQCAERMVQSHEAAWRNAKHRQQWRSTLQTYAYPIFGDVAVAGVDTGLVLKALEPIWTIKAETAGRTRGRIEAVLDWAKARGYRDGENPARWRGHLDKLLPSRRKVQTVKHHAALPFDKLPAFMEQLRARESISARALEFAILTATRTGETIGACETEIAGDVWTIPAERMKGAREHRVPLCRRAVEILDGVPRDSVFLFMGGRQGKPLSNMAMAELLKDLAPGYTVHGFRSTFRDWAAEKTKFTAHVAEAALAHAVPAGVEAAYRRGDLFEKRRELMRVWATYCTSKPREAVVLPIRSAAR